MSGIDSGNVRFGSNGLIPAIVQDADSGDVLMLAYMNDEALRRTSETGRAHYWSRSRGKLWRKGETSGNEQLVIGIRINCEQNSLLLEVKQTGAVCHDGYATCYYRTLADDGSLTIMRERVFDPATVYGSSASSAQENESVAEASRLQYGAYVYLRETDLEAVSGTSRRLRSLNDDSRTRIADELRELASVLTGEHRHTDSENDARLEASQVIYWVIVELVRSGATWNQVRPDRAFETTDESVSPAVLARLLIDDAGRWLSAPGSIDALTASGHATLTLVAHACQAAGIHVLDAINADLGDLRARPYLAAYFSPARQ